MAERIGYPVLLKASAGGGGKGMRVVRRRDEMAAALRQTTGEAGASFGNDAVFVEKYIEDPKHIEVQVLGDGTGNAIHVFERECSVQRRHQKVIEESPSPSLTPELRASICEAAVADRPRRGLPGRRHRRVHPRPRRRRSTSWR